MAHKSLCDTSLRVVLEAQEVSKSVLKWKMFISALGHMNELHSIQPKQIFVFLVKGWSIIFHGDATVFRFLFQPKTTVQHPIKYRKRTLQGNHLLRESDGLQCWVSVA